MINNFLLAVGAILSGNLVISSKNPLIAVLSVATFMLFNVILTQSIVTAISSSGLILLCSAVPIKPAHQQPARLTNKQKAQFNLSTRQEEILIGCTLGDLFVTKCANSVLRTTGP